MSRPLKTEPLSFPQEIEEAGNDLEKSLLKESVGCIYLSFRVVADAKCMFLEPERSCQHDYHSLQSVQDAISKACT